MPASELSLKERIKKLGKTRVIERLIEMERRIRIRKIKRTIPQ